MAVVTELRTALATNTTVSIATSPYPEWNEIPTVGSFTEGVRDMEKGKRVTLRSGDGTPLYPVSASEEELKEMYADLAMTVFLQGRKIEELEEKIKELSK